MNIITSLDHFQKAGEVLVFRPRDTYRFHLVEQSDSPAIPLKLTISNATVIRAEIPDSSGMLTADFLFYQDVVNHRAADKWPEVSQNEFVEQLLCYRQFLSRKAASGRPDLTI